MKARIIIILAIAATAVAALAVASGAVLAPHQSSWTVRPLSIHGWDYTRPGGRLVRPNPTSARGSIHGW
jgi:hypothetical protein